jgi:hypothetical protein
MPKPLHLPKPLPSHPHPLGSPACGASSPSSERIKKAIREANDQSRLVSSPERSLGDWTPSVKR